MPVNGLSFNDRLEAAKVRRAVRFRMYSEHLDRKHESAMHWLYTAVFSAFFLLLVSSSMGCNKPPVNNPCSGAGEWRCNPTSEVAEMCDGEQWSKRFDCGEAEAVCVESGDSVECSR